ncbi:BTAD domain-containing putative transcriptional regulator [Nonomuraea sp. NPDC049709]|uniref:AfsR/SARP family transcriptional regulator n=1 Tax=Nonomuraea sp. NPDC049709 TaxID=3154736 RepID=UPI0034214BB5
MTAVRFSVLGPLTMTRDGMTWSVPGGKIRVLLATLLLRPNQFVTLDQLTERLWPQQPPQNPNRVLQTNIVRLRQSLDLNRAIETEEGGYLLRLEPDQLDLLEFQQLMRRAAATASPVLENQFLHDALGLWRGPACADVESDVLHQIDVPPITEQRLHGLERRIDIDIHLGREAALVAELRALTAEHPLRERLWAQLMITLYRTGRQAEALDTYRTVSHLLKKELGTDPSADLHRLHQAILSPENLPHPHPLAHAHADGDASAEAPVPETRLPAAFTAPTTAASTAAAALGAPAPSPAQDRRQPAPQTEESALGMLLRTWRDRALQTQTQLAGLAGLNVRTIRRLETGELRRPRVTTVRRLAEALGLDDAESSILAQAARGRDGADWIGRTPRQVPTDVSPVAERQPEPVAQGSGDGPGVLEVTPRQLPADVTSFVGRQPELALLGQANDAAAVMITSIEGMAGVGKTALAVHAAHELAAQFPDGNLFVDLHGYTGGMAPDNPADILAQALETLGIADESIPEHLDDRAALYRSVLAGRRMLIVLDNAANEEQVRPLLPGEGGCRVLITSRRRLVGLDEASTVSVDVLPPADAIALFTSTAGRWRLTETPAEDVAEVVQRCGLLPLAIRLAAARLTAHPTWSVRDLLERLDRHHHGLRELHAGQRSVSAALDQSYRVLAATEQRAYRLLGLHAGADITPEAAAALLGTTIESALTLLDRLLEGHMLQESAPGRYRFHGLIRAHAAAEATAQESETDRRAALSRLLTHYRCAASAPTDRLCPTKPTLARAHPGDRSRPP